MVWLLFVMRSRDTFCSFPLSSRILLVPPRLLGLWATGPPGHQDTGTTPGQWDNRTIGRVVVYPSQQPLLWPDLALYIISCVIFRYISLSWNFNLEIQKSNFIQLVRGETICGTNLQNSISLTDKIFCVFHKTCLTPQLGLSSLLLYCTDRLIPL